MAKTIVNLMLPVIQTEVETVLETFPDHPYQQAFAAPDMRQKLVSFILSHMPGMYVVMDGEVICSEGMAASCSGEQRDRIDALIRQGVERILQEESDWVAHHIPEEEDAALSPSNWFG